MSARLRPRGINGDAMPGMAMTLRLADDETEALRRRAGLERRPVIYLSSRRSPPLSVTMAHRS
jgi:hypothetical protein